MLYSDVLRAVCRSRRVCAMMFESGWLERTNNTNNKRKAHIPLDDIIRRTSPRGDDQPLTAESILASVFHALLGSSVDGGGSSGLPIRELLRSNRGRIRCAVCLGQI